jgi:hypothetical protein
MAEEKSLQIVIENDELEDAQAIARTSGVDLQIQPKPQLLDPFTWILIIGTGAYVAKFVADLRDRARGGIVIDLRPNANPFIRREHELPQGWVVIRAADGTVKVDTRDAPKDASERLLAQMIDGPLKSAADVAKEAAKAFGLDKVQESLPSA